MWESTNSNPTGPVGMFGKSETGSSGQIIVITLLSCIHFAVPFTSLFCFKMQGQNHFALPTRHIQTFYSSNFNFQGRIVSTAGAALKHCSRFQIVIQSCMTFYVQLPCEITEVFGPLESGLTLFSLLVIYGAQCVSSQLYSSSAHSKLQSGIQYQFSSSMLFFCHFSRVANYRLCRIFKLHTTVCKQN